MEGSPYISPIALCVVAVVGDPFFLRQKSGKTLHCRCFGFLIVCTGCHASHFHLTDHFPLRILKLRSHREASTSQGIGTRPGEEAIWLLFTSPQPWQSSGSVFLLRCEEFFLVDIPLSSCYHSNSRCKLSIGVAVLAFTSKTCTCFFLDNPPLF